MTPGLYALLGAVIFGALIRLPLALVMFGGGAVYLFTTRQDIGLLVGQVMGQMTAMYVLVASAYILNYAIANERLADSLVAAIAAMQLSQMQFMLVVNLFFLVLGCFLDGSVMMLVFVPLLMPSVRALGIDLTYFGIVVTLNFMIGLITPPYGLLLFVMSSLTRVPLIEIIREVWPFVLTLTVLLLTLTRFPQIILFLPHAFGYK